MNNIYDVNGELQQDAIDVLHELGNMGVATAVMPIGNIREVKIKVAIPNIITIKDDIFSEIVYDPEQVVVGVTTRLNEALDGSVLFLLSREFIRNTIFEMTGIEFSDEELLKDEDSVSAIQEVVNYMTAGYVKVIGSYLKVPVYISAISIGMDKVSTLIHSITKQQSHGIEQIACVNTRFTVVDEKGKYANESGQVLIFPDEKCVEKFMDIMRERA